MKRHSSKTLLGEGETKCRRLNQISVGIVGSAGRGGDRTVLDRGGRVMFDRTVVRSREVVARWASSAKANVLLVSGGSAWADHITVRVWIEAILSERDEAVTRLRLYLPCAIASDRRSFVDTGSSQWYKNPGRTLNRLHRQFKAATGIDGVVDIVTAEAMGADIVVCAGGFHARNTKIACTADLLLAVTTSRGDEPPAKGGTRDTWNKFTSRQRLVGKALQRTHLSFVCEG